MASAHQIPWGWMEGKTFRIKYDIPDRTEIADSLVAIPKGTEVKVTMCSGMGDVGIVYPPDPKRNYTHRLPLFFFFERVEGQEYSLEVDWPDYMNDRMKKYETEEFGGICEQTYEVLDESYWKPGYVC